MPPIVPVRIDERKPPQFHHEIGKRFAFLRKEGILVVSSGDIVHNLTAAAWGTRMATQKIY
jgi:4,5-DOPA dioxygenase extradiol